jgi:Uma2 family endonuclease
MATVETAVTPETLADLFKRIGKIPLERIPLRPGPGKATEEDVIAALERVDKRLYELVDGVLVEKPMGKREGLFSALVGHFLLDFLEENDLGVVLGADGPIRLRLGLVRIPDVCFIHWEKLPEGELSDESISSVIPDLAIEILSPSNTKSEMKRKLKDYFEAGVRLVWFIQPKTETAEVYTSPTNVRQIPREGILYGEDILPGFSLPLKKLFARLKRRPRIGRRREEN